MKAMILRSAGGPLEYAEVPTPVPLKGQIRVAVRSCGVCRTDIHLIDDELPDIHLPIIPGHEVVGTVDAIGPGVSDFAIGDRVGVPWMGHTCGRCWYCIHEQENLCDEPGFTGYTSDGGFAEYIVADADYCFTLPEQYSDEQAAPLLCAGLIGYRSLVMAGRAENIGIYGFGAAAHIVTQVAIWQGRDVYAFTRPDDNQSQQFARKLGAVWAGGSDQRPPLELDAAIIFAPVGSLVPAALRVLRKGGTVVCAGIHMSQIPAFAYDILWGERQIRSVANLTRQDAIDFLEIAPRVPIETHTVAFPLQDANDAIAAVRAGSIDGAAVLLV